MEQNTVVSILLTIGSLGIISGAGVLYYQQTTVGRIQQDIAGLRGELVNQGVAISLKADVNTNVNVQPKAEGVLAQEEAIASAKVWREQLDALVAGLKVEDPATMKHNGCGLIHGEDSKVANWNKYSSEYLGRLFAFLSASTLKATVVKLDRSKDAIPASDEVWIVVCGCDKYDWAKKTMAEQELDFGGLDWQSEDREGDPMVACFSQLPW